MIAPSASRASRVLVAALLAGALLALLPGTGRAQYFGRNKVQYEDFHFRVLETEHFDVYYYPEEEAGARMAARMAERWYTRLSGIFGHQFKKRKPIILYADQPDFQQTNTTPSTISEATGGFTEGLKDRVVLPFAGTFGDTDHVLGHELVHAFQYDLAEQAANKEGPAAIQTLPLWAIEGLAEYLSLGRDDVHTAMWMRDAVRRDDFPSLDDLSTNPRYFPYRFGEAFWAYVGGEYGDEVVTTLYRTVGAEGLKGAVQKTLAMDVDSLGARWARDTKAYYAPLLAGRTAPDSVGEPLLKERREGDWTLAPALSPDGTKVAFLSQRDVFTFDLWLADARTGKVLGKLASNARNPHFDALAFTNTSGAWSPDGRRFAFVTYANGDNQVAIADVATRTVVRTLALDGVGAVSSLAWSPDGSRLALAGQAGGVPDLWTVDLATGAVERRTDDVFAELGPEFSPDGTTIVFATDRGDSTDVRRLEFPKTGLGFLDLSTGKVTVRRPFPDAKTVDPRYSPDGSSVYFVSDPDGFSDVYRLDLGTGAVFRVTKVATGVSGITPLAPALSVARGTGELAFTVFDAGDYRGRTLAADQARGEPVQPAALAEAAPAAGVLPPARQAPRIYVTRYLADATTGLPPAGDSLASRAYHPSLSLDYVAPPTAGVAVDRFGAGIGGSIGLFWSDMLGDDQLLTAIQANGGLKDIGGEAVYASLGDRLNWGVRGGRIPYLSTYVTIGQGTVNGQPAQVVEQVLQRTFYNEASLLADYPFSPTRRIEGEAGYTRVGFDNEAIQTFIQGGAVVDERRTSLDAPPGIDLFHASAALVSDWSYFGFTSPVRGGRSRLEVGQNVGDLDFTTLLVDWRRYFFVRPVTFAVRGLHYGRYGKGAGDPRLSPLFLGYQSLVRGYTSGSFQTGECTPVPDDPTACPEFDRLVGSRIGVVNAELRLPLVGTDQFGILKGGFLPTELAFFVDGGVAWSADHSPKFELTRRSTARIPVFSAGASARVNLFGTLVAEIYWAYPFERPGAGGQFGFQIAPGW